MTEEIKKNTVATVGMRFSIIWLIALITVFLARLWLPLLFVGLILWIIGLFHKPRGKARVAVIIPLVVLIAFVSIACYMWNSVKAPANEFISRAETKVEQLKTDENFNDEAFGNLVENEINNIVNNKTEDEWKALFETSTGSNIIEKGSYLIFSVLQQGFENALEKYNNGELPEINEENNNIIDIDVEVNENEEDVEEDIEEESTEEEVTIEQPKNTSNETFSQSEKNDIEEILDILE